MLLAPVEQDGQQTPAVALIAGSAVNQDGKSAALTAPHGPSQTRLIRDALLSSAMDAQSVALLASHGTGTPLGDPIESGAALAALGTHPVAFAAPKSCLGHTEGAAGLAGLAAAAGAVALFAQPLVLHLRSLNPTVAVGAQGARFGRQPAPLLGSAESRAGRLLSGTSSFGMSGVNAHVLIAGIENAVQKLEMSARSVPYERMRVWPLPARHWTLESAAPHRSSFAARVDLATAPVVSVWQRPIVASTVSLELFAASVAALAAERQGPASAGQSLLTDVTLSLLEVGSSLPLELEVTYDAASGDLCGRRGAEKDSSSFGQATCVQAWLEHPTAMQDACRPRIAASWLPWQQPRSPLQTTKLATLDVSRLGKAASSTLTTASMTLSDASLLFSVRATDLTPNGPEIASAHCSAGPTTTIATIGDGRISVLDAVRVAPPSALCELSSDLLWELDWKDVDCAEESAAAPVTTLVIGDSASMELAAGLFEDTSRRVQQACWVVSELDTASTFLPQPPGRIHLGTAEHLEGLFQALLPQQICWAHADATESASDDLPSALDGYLRLWERVLRTPQAGMSLVTLGGARPSPAASVLESIARTCFMEHRASYRASVSIRAPKQQLPSGKALLSTLWASTEYALCLEQDGCWQALRLVPRRGQAVVGADRWFTGGGVLVTGGTQVCGRQIVCCALSKDNIISAPF